MDYKLSRLNITGKVNKNTPLCVLVEICNAHGIKINNEYIHNEKYIDKIIETINEDDVPEIKMPYSKADYPKIARFINESCKWDEASLIESFKFLTESSNKKVHDFLNDIDFTISGFGSQTPEAKYNINKCLMYSILKKSNVDTFYNMSYKVLLNSFLMLCFNNRTDYLDLIPLNVIINLLNNGTISRKYNNKKIIAKISQRLKDNDEPTSDYEAIILAARKYKINLINDEFPLYEYFSYDENKQYNKNIDDIV